MHENKTFLFLFFWCLDNKKTGYFNTEFVSLQYKNTNRYWSKCNNKFAENHMFFWNNFFEFFFPTQNKQWTGYCAELIIISRLLWLCTVTG
jgi:hypothetical protein